MIKVFITVIFCCLCLIFTVISSAFCVSNTQNQIMIDPNELLKTIDEDIFVRSFYFQDYSEPQGYVNELPNENSIHQFYSYDGVATDVLMSMLPSTSTIQGGNKYLNLNQARKDEFHVSYSVQQKENIPANKGGKCWIRYSNVAVKGVGNESGIILYPGGPVYFFEPNEGKISFEKVADLSNLNPNKPINFDFIRLDGVIYAYANGEFLFNHADLIKEPVSFEAGAELLPGGNRIRCDFDNFSMRIK